MTMVTLVCLFKATRLQGVRLRLVLLLVPFVLSSCATFTRITGIGEREPQGRVASESEAGEWVSAESREEPVRVVRQSGQITGDSVNIRAGASINYEILGKLNEEDRISILGSALDWSEIELPPRFFVWIHSDYVSVPYVPSEDGRVTGSVTGDSVRIRARAGLKCSVLSKVNKGDKVVVVASEGEWFKIEPTEQCTGWVYSDFVKIH